MGWRQEAGGWAGAEAQANRKENFALDGRVLDASGDPSEFQKNRKFELWDALAASKRREILQIGSLARRKNLRLTSWFALSRFILRQKGSNMESVGFWLG